ncbi:MAG: PHP domain-containing protein [Oscillibacter sp.]
MKCDMHVHSDLSADSASKPEKIIAAAKRRGMDAIVLANHNRVMPRAVLDALESSGIYIISGAEYSTDIGHVLALFTDAHIETLGLKMYEGVYPYREVIAAIHTLGGQAILAHPFADGKAVDPSILSAFDGIEAANSRSGYRAHGTANQMAAEAARGADLQTAGSDSHFLFEIGRSYVELDIQRPYTKEKILAALGNHPKIVSRPTNPMVMSASQIYKNLASGHYGTACKHAVKLVLRLSMLFPRAFGVTPYSRNQ